MYFGIAPPPHYQSQNLDNRIIYVLGSHPRNFDSTISLLQRLDNIKPSLLCLADFHPDSHKNYRFFNTNKIYSSVKFPYTENDLLIKSQFSTYFNKEYPLNLFYYHDESGNFYYMDIETKRLIPDDSLSAAHWGYLDRGCSLVACGAHPFMIHEDLCHNLTLDRMKHMFHHTVEAYLRKSKALGWDPVYHPIDLYYFLHTMSKNSFPEELIR